MATASKYDQFGRPTDGSEKNWMVARPHGRGNGVLETQALAEACATRWAVQYGEPICVWRRMTEFFVADPPVARRDFTESMEVK